MECAGRTCRDLGKRICSSYRFAAHTQQADLKRRAAWLRPNPGGCGGCSTTSKRGRRTQNQLEIADTSIQNKTPRKLIPKTCTASSRTGSQMERAGRTYRDWGNLFAAAIDLQHISEFEAQGCRAAPQPGGLRQMQHTTSKRRRPEPALTHASVETKTHQKLIPKTQTASSCNAS